MSLRGAFLLCHCEEWSDEAIIVIYKVVDSTWTKIPITAITVIDATTVAVTIEVGDPILVFGRGAPPPTGVGGTAYPANKLLVLAPWIVLAAAIIAGAAIFVRRRRAQS